VSINAIGGPVNPHQRGLYEYLRGPLRPSPRTPWGSMDLRLRTYALEGRHFSKKVRQTIKSRIFSSKRPEIEPFYKVFYTKEEEDTVKEIRKLF
jgi:hypothetical protein